MLVVVAAAPASAQNFEQGLRDPRLISPAGLGPVYSGLTGAGVGLLSKKPAYGVLAGDFILQPRFFLEGSYNSNFFRIDDRNGDAEGVFTTHIRPGVALFNPLLYCQHENAIVILIAFGVSSRISLARR